MRIAVLVKQIPKADQLELVGDRLRREGVELEVNAYCRRANAKAVELAGLGGLVVAFTMGPPSAEEALREMIACGATRGVHLCDPAFAGADTLATARALAAALRREGPFDLVLAGLNSLDADTGQVGPQTAEMLGLPFAPGVRELHVEGDVVQAKLETDDGHRWIEARMPVVLSAAERLCEPSKAPFEARAAVNADRIVRFTQADTGLRSDEIGAAGSPTSVGRVRLEATKRHRQTAASPAEAVQLLTELGAFGADVEDLEAVPQSGGHGPSVWCFVCPGNPTAAKELLGEAAAIAAKVGGAVTAIVPDPVLAGLGALGADRVLVIPDASEPDQWMRALADAARTAEPWALLVDGSRTGRAVASSVAASLCVGLVGDAIALEVGIDGRLLAMKPAFGGQLVAPIASRSRIQIVTVRAGVLRQRHPRRAPDPEPEVLPHPGPPRVRTIEVSVDDPAVHDMVTARQLVGIGTGVSPEEYPLLDGLRNALGGAPLAATRKVTDRGWLPRSRQLGVTGHAVGPQLYVAIGLSGKLNHMIGVRNARTVLAINDDRTAPVFQHSDVGLVGDWHDLVPALVEALTLRPAGI